MEVRRNFARAPSSLPRCAGLTKLRLKTQMKWKYPSEMEVRRADSAKIGNLYSGRSAA
jgi:hypothetical protein